MSWRLLEEPAAFDGLRTLTGGRRLAHELVWLSVDRVAQLRAGRLVQKSWSMVIAVESSEESRTSRYSRPGGQTAFRGMALSEAARLLSYFVRRGAHRGGGVMSTTGEPNTIELCGFDTAGLPVYLLNLSIAEFPKAKHLWDDAEYMRSHRIARLLGTLRRADASNSMHILRSDLISSRS